MHPPTSPHLPSGLDGALQPPMGLFRGALAHRFFHRSQPHQQNPKRSLLDGILSCREPKNREDSHRELAKVQKKYCCRDLLFWEQTALKRRRRRGSIIWRWVMAPGDSPVDLPGVGRTRGSHGGPARFGPIRIYGLTLYQPL